MSNEIPPAVTLYWQEQEIKRLTADVKRLIADGNRATALIGERCEQLEAENERLRAVLAATQKALKEMQAQRDKAREGKLR